MEFLTQNLSEWIRVVSFLCALLIVPIHASFLGQQVELSAFDRAIITVLSDGICRIAVPAFFVISGFFLAIGWRKNQGKSWYCSLLKKRFRTLYIPFVLWNMIYFAFQLVNGKGWGQFIERILGWNLFVKPACMQFWYLQTLFVFILLAPVFIWIFRKRIFGCVTLIVLLLLSFYLKLTQVLQLSNFFFVSLGVLLGFNIEYFEGIVCCIPSPPRRLLQIAHYSFFLYAVHYIFINLTAKALSFYSLPILAVYFSKIFTGIVLSLCCASFVKQYLPQSYKLLTGGR